MCVPGGECACEESAARFSASVSLVVAFMVTSVSATEKWYLFSLRANSKMQSVVRRAQDV